MPRCAVREMWLITFQEHHIARPLAHAAYTLGADRNKYPFIRPLRKTWCTFCDHSSSRRADLNASVGKYVGAVDVPWTHPSGANGFALLMGTAWDSMRAVGAHVGGEWTLEDFATIERCATRGAEGTSGV
jgi:hypothetical protein